MSALLLAAVLCVADEPTYPVVVELDNVCGRDCVAILEKALAKVDGVKSADMYGDKFHFKLEVLENKPLLPSRILQVVDKIRIASKGEEDFPLVSFEATIAGTIETQTKGLVLIARGSGQKYALIPGEGLKIFLAAGKTKLTLSGKITEPKRNDGVQPLPVLEVGEAKETPQ
ncbi:MAG TPA: hypothetical protein VMU54_19725 [Planctomycetota bacterium]|nr:hypothetical protein [Planctomycetota bacterium]